ncbi:MAG: adenylate/guanylate cyclase domain-containing protein, partial [Polyangiaceae bacterium]
LRAVRCAVDMIEAVRTLNEGRSLDGVAIGVGINAGAAIVGAMGSEDRMDFTAIGDTVNLGARLCSNAGRWQVLVSNEVREKVGDRKDLSFTPLDPLTVKGKAQPVPVFAVEATSEVRSVPPKSAPPKPSARA